MPTKSEISRNITSSGLKDVWKKVLPPGGSSDTRILCSTIFYLLLYFPDYTAQMYHLYILKCSDNSLYTGITTDIERRLEVHRSGKGSKYVRARLPFILIYQEEYPDKSTASKREAEIKSWSRAEKIKKLGLM